jgi:prevent-host-death family protein
MKKASISETKNNLSALLDLVRNGETIIITDRNHSIARIEPISRTGKSDDESRLARLERAGILKRAKKTSTRPLDFSPIKTQKKTSVLKALLAEREESR